VTNLRDVSADENDDDDRGSLDLLQAAEYLGVSPTALARLLDNGALPWVNNGDVRHRRVRLADLDAHRDERFALRQKIAAQTRERRYAGGTALGEGLVS
jgi:excisionase family DNA binding protein